MLSSFSNRGVNLLLLTGNGKFGSSRTLAILTLAAYTKFLGHIAHATNGTTASRAVAKAKSLLSLTLYHSDFTVIIKQREPTAPKSTSSIRRRDVGTLADSLPRCKPILQDPQCATTMQAARTWRGRRCETFLTLPSESIQAMIPSANQMTQLDDPSRKLALSASLLACQATLPSLPAQPLAQILNCCFSSSA